MRFKVKAFGPSGLPDFHLSAPPVCPALPQPPGVLAAEHPPFPTAEDAASTSVAPLNWAAVGISWELSRFFWCPIPTSQRQVELA